MSSTSSKEKEDICFQDRNDEILECRRQIQSWTTRLNALEQQQRRDFLLGWLSCDPQAAWPEMTSEEQRSKEFCWQAIQAEPNFFGLSVNPWLIEAWRGPHLPSELLRDRDIFKTFVSCQEFSEHYFRFAFQVPEWFLDDTELMFLVCSVSPSSFEFAPKRLRRDGAFILKVIRAGKCRYYGDMIKQVCKEALHDTDFIMGAIPLFIQDDVSWMKDASIDTLKIDDQKKILLTLLQLYKKALKEEGGRGYLDDILPCFSSQVYDDQEQMVQCIRMEQDCFRFCSERLQKCPDIIQVADKAVVYKYLSQKERPTITATTDREVVFQELDKGFPFGDLPDELQNDLEIATEGLENGWVKYSNLPLPIRHLKTIICHEANQNEDVYSSLPENLQKDEAVALGLIESGNEYAFKILDRFPSFLHSKHAMLKFLEIRPGDCWCGRVAAALEKCPVWLRDDEEIVRTACINEMESLEFASDRLKSDRSFLLSVWSENEDSSLIGETPAEFQLANTDLVCKAIEINAGDCISTERLRDDLLAPCVWDRKEVVLKWLQNDARNHGRSKKASYTILSKVSSLALLNDKEVIRSAVQVSPSELRYALIGLRSDSDFILELAKDFGGHVLPYAPRTVQRDFRVMTTAIATYPGAIAECFDYTCREDFELLCALAKSIRTRLEQHSIFVGTFLAAISCHRPPAAPAIRCRLSILDRGTETSTALKKSIAEFADIPIAHDLSVLRAANSSLKKFGL
jgi:hypothetical protein